MTFVAFLDMLFVLSASGPPCLTGHNEHKDMSDDSDPRTDQSQPMVYQIRLKGHLRREWTDWFGGLTITLEDNGNTLVTGPVVDQAALYGMLRKVRDLGMPLLSVTRVEPGLSTKLETGKVDPGMPEGKLRKALSLMQVVIVKKGEKG
jgi:hypothetical protein